MAENDVTVVDEDVMALAAEVIDLLRERGETLATAESLTGGLVSAALTSVPGSSEAYGGGLVTYATELKVRLLGVPESLVEAHGVISRECALAMATGAAARTGAGWGLSTTGVAGPDTQEGRPAGTVFVGVHGTTGVEEGRDLALSGDRAEVRAGSVVGALELLREVLLSENERG